MKPRPLAVPPPLRVQVRPGVWLDSRRALWFSAERRLALADLHWGYAASHRARGNLLPNWGDEDLERRLEGLLRDYAPAAMIWLGDIVHAAEGASRLEQWLGACATPILMLAGNHDRRWTGARERCAQVGRYFFHHGDRAEQIPEGAIEVVGHLHPALIWQKGPDRLKLPALIASPKRLVLPAFSPWAGGADCTPALTPDATAWAIAPTRIFPVTGPAAAPMDV